jgi:hypothetical protein
MFLSGFKLPEAIGFGVLGATIGAVVCDEGGGGLAEHTGLGMLVGALLLIGLAQMPVRRTLDLLLRVRIAARNH